MSSGSEGSNSRCPDPSTLLRFGFACLAAYIYLVSFAVGHGAAHTRRPAATREMQAQQNVASYTQSPRQVGEAVTAVLVQRKELAADIAPQVTADLATAAERREPGHLSSKSMKVTREDLLRMVAEPFRKFVGDAGGRYVVNITVEPTEGGGARVRVIPTIIATVPGAEGPLGGRVLRSNGTIESEILQAIAARLKP